MSYLVANPKDRFSHDMVHIIFQPVPAQQVEQEACRLKSGVDITILMSETSALPRYLKNPKNLDARKNCCNHPYPKI